MKCHRGGFRTVIYFKFSQNVFDMEFSGTFSASQHFADFFVAQAFDQ